MYGFISGVSDTDDIKYCTKCGSDDLERFCDGTVKCCECGYKFGVVEDEKIEEQEKNVTVGELITNIIKMLEEDMINITDEVQVDIKQGEKIIGGNAHELMTEITFHNATKLTIRS